MMERIDQGLHEELGDMQSEIERATDAVSLLQWLERRFAKHEGFDFQVTRTDGSRFFASDRLSDKSLPLADSTTNLSEPIYDNVTSGPANRWRVVSIQVRGPGGPLIVQIGRPLEDFEHESGELLAVFLTTGPLMVLVTLAGGYFLARRALAPVRRIADTARQISADRLGQRVAVDNPGDEFGSLAATMNEMLDRLERSFSEMQRFTADAAHELRTPLAVIRNEAEVALRQPRSVEEYGRALESLLEETVRLGRMADQLLFLSRQDAGLNPPLSKDVPLDAVIRDVVENMRLVANECGITLDLAANPPCLVRGDENQLRRVFYNLIDNAIKYTKPGGIVTLNSRLDDTTVIVTVEDTGIGIPADHIPRIFDRFYRVDPSRTGDTGGTGLGLSICRAVVQATGGSVAVSSIEGRGSVFEVKLTYYHSISTQNHG